MAAEDVVLEVLRWLAIVILICCSGLFSGLNLGLMGLDKIGLEIVMESGSVKEREYARKIYPLRRKGNLLLCVILLGNVAVNAAFTLLLAEYTSSTAGFFLSTAFIVVFGEITPQAICSRHGLAVGAHTIYLVRFFMAALFIVAWPISKLLDYILGREIGTVYSKQELKKLVSIHQEQNQLSQEETTMLRGTLDFANKTVAETMTPLKNVFMLSVDAILDFTTIQTIFEKGHSRIPVYDGDAAQNLIGLLFVKDLSLLNPDDEIAVRTVLSVSSRSFIKVFYDLPLNEMLAQFKRGNVGSHLAVVHRVNNEGEGDPFYENVGIITLEDVIEELIGDEIIDETDIYVDLRQMTTPLSNPSNPKGRAAAVTALAGGRRRDRLGPEQLSSAQQSAVMSFFMSDAGPDAFTEDKISYNVLEKLILQGRLRTVTPDIVTIDPVKSAKAPVHQDSVDLMLDQSSTGTGVSSVATSGSAAVATTTPLLGGSGGAAGAKVQVSSQVPAPPSEKHGQALYEHGVATNMFTLILQGRCEILSGKDKFRSEVGPFCCLGTDCLESREPLMPDFTALPLAPSVQVFQLTQSQYQVAVETTKIERKAHVRPRGPSNDHSQSPNLLDGLESTATPENGQRASQSAAQGVHPSPENAPHVVEMSVLDASTPDVKNGDAPKSSKEDAGPGTDLV